jgi:hypothetical protein
VQVVHACKSIFLVFEIRRIIIPGQSRCQNVRLPHLREKKLHRVGIPVILVTSKKHKEEVKGSGGLGTKGILSLNNQRKKCLEERFKSIVLKM